MQELHLQDCLICCRQLSTRSSEVAPTAADCYASIRIRWWQFFVYRVIFQIIMDFIELTQLIWSINDDINCSAVNKWCSALTGEVNGEAGLGDIKICLKLNGDDVEGRMNPIRKQRAAHFLQWHFILWRPIPNLQDVVGRLRVECKKLQTEKIRPQQIITWSQIYSHLLCALDTQLNVSTALGLSKTLLLKCNNNDVTKT